VLVLVSTTPQLNVSFPVGFGVFNIAQSSTTGLSGASGTSGATGATGASGVTGVSGATGATGTTAGGQCATIERQSSITSTDNSSLLNFFAVATNSGSTPWLFVAPNTGDTPGTVTVLIDPSYLTVGTYAGTITISPGVPGATGASGTSGASGASGTTGSLPVPFSIPVTLTVTNRSSSTAAPVEQAAPPEPSAALWEVFPTSDGNVSPPQPGNGGGSMPRPLPIFFGTG
jgi:hypothetical protein